MVELYHAFYSKKQENIKINLNKTHKDIHPANIYKLHNSNNYVKVTEVYQVTKYPNYKDCDIRFNDSQYLGIVDLWISHG